jgi:hypothetical protein
MRLSTERIADLERRAEVLTPVPHRGHVLAADEASMGEHLARLSAARRGLLDDQEEAEVRAFSSMVAEETAEGGGDT